jgi:hypothetical protein
MRSDTYISILSYDPKDNKYEALLQRQLLLL